MKFYRFSRFSSISFIPAKSTSSSALLKREEAGKKRSEQTARPPPDSDDLLQRLEEHVTMNGKQQHHSLQRLQHSSVQHKSSLPTSAGGYDDTPVKWLARYGHSRITGASHHVNGPVHSDSYELSDDFQQRQVDALERKYGGRLKAQRAARVIQRAWRDRLLARRWRRVRDPTIRRQVQRYQTTSFLGNYSHGGQQQAPLIYAASPSRTAAIPPPSVLVSPRMPRHSARTSGRQTADGQSYRPGDQSNNRQLNLHKYTVSPEGREEARLVHNVHKKSAPPNVLLRSAQSASAVQQARSSSVDRRHRQPQILSRESEILQHPSPASSPSSVPLPPLATQTFTDDYYATYVRNHMSDASLGSGGSGGYGDSPLVDMPPYVGCSHACCRQPSVHHYQMVRYGSSGCCDQSPSHSSVASNGTPVHSPVWVPRSPHSPANPHPKRVPVPPNDTRSPISPPHVAIATNHHQRPVIAAKPTPVHTTPVRTFESELERRRQYRIALNFFNK